MSGCRLARRRIHLAVDGRLSVEERFLLDDHLSSCDRCARMHAELAAVGEGLERLPDPPLQRLDLDAAVARVTAALSSAPRAGAPRTPVARRLAVAAVVLLAAGAAAWSLAALLTPRSPGGVRVVAAAPGDATATSLVPGPPPSEAEAPGETEAPPEAATPGEEPDQLRLERLVDVRLALEKELLSAFAGIDLEAPSGEGVEVAARRVDALARELGPDWSLRRNAEGLLASEDAGVARAAARYVGARGDRVSVASLGRALDRDDRAGAVVQALGDLGAVGLPGLATALDGEAPVVELAVARVTAIGGPEAARVLEQALAASRPSESAAERRRQELLLHALIEVGPPAVESLLRLAARVDSERATYVYSVGYVEGAHRRVVALLEEDPRQWGMDALLNAVAVLQPREALPRLAELACEPAHRLGALGCLASWNSAAPLETLVRLWAGGRVSRERVVGVTRSVLAVDPEGAAERARDLAGGGELVLAGELLDLLLATEQPAAGLALAELALSELLPTDQRQWAALAIAELEDVDGMHRLAEGLATLTRPDRRLLAAGLLTIYALGGPTEVRRALAGTEQDTERVLSALSLSEGGALGVHRVARELIVRAPRDPKSRRSTL